MTPVVALAPPRPAAAAAARSRELRVAAGVQTAWLRDLAAAADRPGGASPRPA